MHSDLQVLLIEDDTQIQRIWDRVLGEHGIQALCAYTIEEAIELFDLHKGHISAISVDGCVPGSELNTRPLIKKFVGEYDGPIIAASGDSFYRKLMIEAGCTHECTRKLGLPEFLLSLLESHNRRPAA